MSTIPEIHPGQCPLLGLGNPPLSCAREARIPILVILAFSRKTANNPGMHHQSLLPVNPAGQSGLRFKKILTDWNHELLPVLHQK
jgi:hypothetical protein